MKIKTLTGLPIVYETVVHMLRASAQQAEDNGIALLCEKDELTYTEYLRCVAGFAHFLNQLGVRSGRVALICNNSIEMAVAMFAVHAAGAQVVPINPMYTTRELSHILDDAEPLVIIYDAVLAKTLEPISAELKIPHNYRIEEQVGASIGSWRLDADIELPQPLPKATDLATLQYTGGTTGLPKGVNITHGQMSINISQREAVLPTHKDEEVILCVMPLFHVFAVSMCLHLAAYCRGELLILPRYKPNLVFDAISNKHVTRLPAGPTVFIGLMRAEGFADTDFSKLRTAYSGSAPLPEEALREWEEKTQCPILEGYGQTEAGPILTYIGEDMQGKVGSVGPVLPDTEIQIVDLEEGERVLGIGERGEIRARGLQIMAGYRNLPEETAETLRNGWLYTGDIGEFDEDGYLYIRDRKKDMVISSGYNVYPREVEEVLYQNPQISEAAVIGVPDNYRGEVLVSFVVLKPDAHTSEVELLKYCATNLAKYKVPARILFVDTLPKTSVGKINKNDLRTYVEL